MIQAIFLTLLLLPGYAAAFSYTVTDVRGKDAFVLSEGSSQRRGAQAGMSLSEGESLQTGPRSVISVTSSNGHKIQVGPNSYVSLRDAGREGGEAFNVVELIGGSMRSIVRKGGDSKKFEVRHAGVSIGVRGTDFLTLVTGEGVDVLLNEGKLFLQSTVALTEGHQATISASGEVLKTSSMSRFEFARAIERAGFGSDGNDGGGGGVPPAEEPPPRKKNLSTEELIKRGDADGLRELGYSGGELNEQHAMLVAVTNRRAEMVPVLAELGADVDTRDEHGKSALMLAIESGHLPTIQALLKAGASKSLQDDKGRNARDYGGSSEDRQIRSLFSR